MLNIKQQQGFAPKTVVVFEKINVKTANHPGRQGKPEPDFTSIPPLQKRKPGRSRGSLPDMFAGQPAQPPTGLASPVPPVVGLAPDFTVFPLRAPASRSGFAPAHRKPVGSGARSRRHAFPRFRRGRPWAGSAPTTGGTRLLPGAPVRFQSRTPLTLGEPGHRFPPPTGASCFKSGEPGHPFPPPFKIPAASWGNATVPVPHLTGTGSPRGGNPRNRFPHPPRIPTRSPTLPPDAPRASLHPRHAPNPDPVSSIPLRRTERP